MGGWGCLSSLLPFVLTVGVVGESVVDAGARAALEDASPSAGTAGREAEPPLVPRGFGALSSHWSTRGMIWLFVVGGECLS